MDKRNVLLRFDWVFYLFFSVELTHFRHLILQLAVHQAVRVLKAQARSIRLRLHRRLIALQLAQIISGFISKVTGPIWVFLKNRLVDPQDVMVAIFDSHYRNPNTWKFSWTYFEHHWENLSFSEKLTCRTSMVISKSILMLEFVIRGCET